MKEPRFEQPVPPKAEVIELKPESDPVIAAEEKDLQAIVSEVEAVSEAVLERPPLSEQDKADISASPTENPYWRARLKDKLDSVPDDIRPLMVKMMSFQLSDPAEAGQVHDYIKQWQRALIEGKGLSEAEAVRARKEWREIERQRLEDFKRQSVRVIPIKTREAGTKENKPASQPKLGSEKRQKAPSAGQGELVLVMSEQERADLKNGKISSGWMPYWYKRLLPELDILPSDVQKIIAQMAEQKTIDGDQVEVLKSYVVRRARVLELNIQKRSAMAQLKKRLRAIDRQENYAEQERADRRVVSYDETTGELYVLSGGQKKKVTVGDIAADLEWGVRYAPDGSVPRPLWRKIRKLSDLTEAKQKVELVFNQELSELESVTLPTTSLTKEWLEQHYESTGAGGIVAERMAKNLLKRLQHNHPELGLRVENSNAIEDSELKYDFKVLMSRKRRGIATEPADMTREDYVNEKKNVGIQFTISTSGIKAKEEKTEKGRKRLKDPRYVRLVKKPVDDVIVVRLKFNASRIFTRWLDEGKPSGGPEQYLTREQKVTILKKSIEGRLELTDEQIAKLVF